MTQSILHAAEGKLAFASWRLD